jgi:hypothetical protein
MTHKTKKGLKVKLADAKRPVDVANRRHLVLITICRRWKKLKTK